MEVLIAVRLYVGQEAKPLMIGQVRPTDFESLLRMFDASGLEAWGAHYKYKKYRMTVDDGLMIADMFFEQEEV